MSFSPENAAVKLTAQQEEAMKAMSFEQIKEYMKSQAIEQGLVRQEWDSTILTPIEQPRQFSKQVIVDGVRILIDGATETEVLQKENNMLRELGKQHPAVPTAAAVTEAQPRSADGRFAEQPKAPVVVDDATKTALATQLQLGQISVAEYIEKSGAVSEYLEKQGVPLAELKTAVQERQDSTFQQSWADATNTFIQNHSDWPGGDENMQIIGRIIAENNLVDAEDKEAALEAAYKHAVENNLLTDTPETEMARRIAAARTPEEIQAAIGYRENRGETAGLWNR